MTDDGLDFNPPRNGEDFIPNVPNLAKRAPERAEKPVKATQADVEARMDAIVRGIIARDGQQLKYRGRGR